MGIYVFSLYFYFTFSSHHNELEWHFLHKLLNFSRKLSTMSVFFGHSNSFIDKMICMLVFKRANHCFKTFQLCFRLVSLPVLFLFEVFNYTWKIQGKRKKIAEFDSLTSIVQYLNVNFHSAEKAESLENFKVKLIAPLRKIHDEKQDQTIKKKTKKQLTRKE